MTFEAVIRGGDYEGETVIVSTTIYDIFGPHFRMPETGDRVILSSFDSFEWHFVDYVRINRVAVLGAIFVALLLLFGRTKGLNSILALGFTCIAVFAVLIPSILSGGNIYAATIIVCAFSIIVTIFLVNGISRKSLAAVSGCLGGVIVAAVITLVMNNLLWLTGVVSGEEMSLLHLPLDEPIDLRAIIFGGILIGAVGAVMDVAVSISSALWEVKEQAPKLAFRDIYKSGVNIGRDIMGSMTNTLVLAYIGSSLSVVLLLIVFSGSYIELLNQELVIVELLQAIIGSLGILMTMPLTALICAALYSKKPGSGSL